MVNGLAVYLSFADDEASGRFKSWMLRGNARSGYMGMASLGLKASARLVGYNNYLFLYSHDFFISFSLLLRLSLWLQFRKLRKRVVITRVKKLPLVERVVSGGFEDVI